MICQSNDKINVDVKASVSNEHKEIIFVYHFK